MGEWTVGDGRVRLPPWVMVTLLRTVIEVCGLIPASAAMEVKAKWSKDRLPTKYRAQEPPTSCSSVYNIDRWTWWILLAFWPLLKTQQRDELFDLCMKVKRPNRFSLKEAFCVHYMRKVWRKPKSLNTMWCYCCFYLGCSAEAFWKSCGNNNYTEHFQTRWWKYNVLVIEGYEHKGSLLSLCCVSSSSAASSWVLHSSVTF